jgi:glycosyltransferase involved in cell wall biosynthesis
VRVVGISLLTLVPGAVGGSETYARALTQALATHGELDYRVLLPSLAPDAAGGLPHEVATEYPASRSSPGRLRAMALAALRPARLRERLRGCRPVHFPLTVPAPSVEGPSVVTLHDLQHRDLPELFSRAERAFRSFAYDRAARQAAAVIVPSAFVRGRAVERLGLDGVRVHVVPHGLDHERFSPDGDVEREPFLLYPAKGWPHKNHARLFEALPLLRRERPELRLVLTGFEGPAPDGVERRGHVSRDELAALYRRAACLVFPSRYEGFGQPPLEAMASGCPVAASNAASLPEVCDDAAVLFDPDDPAAIARGVLESLERADELRGRGLVHAARFTWEASARGHEAVYAPLS